MGIHAFVVDDPNYREIAGYEIEVHVFETPFFRKDPVKLELWATQIADEFVRRVIDEAELVEHAIRICVKTPGGTVLCDTIGLNIQR